MKYIRIYLGKHPLIKLKGKNSSQMIIITIPYLISFIFSNSLMCLCLCFDRSPNFISKICAGSNVVIIFKDGTNALEHSVFEMQSQQFRSNPFFR